MNFFILLIILYTIKTNTLDLFYKYSVERAFHNYQKSIKIIYTILVSAGEGPGVCGWCCQGDGRGHGSDSSPTGRQGWECFHPLHFDWISTFVVNIYS